MFVFYMYLNKALSNNPDTVDLRRHRVNLYVTVMDTTDRVHTLHRYGHIGQMIPSQEGYHTGKLWTQGVRFKMKTAESCLHRNITQINYICHKKVNFSYTYVNHTDVNYQLHTIILTKDNIPWRFGYLAMILSIYIYIYIYVCVCVCVCIAILYSMLYLITLQWRHNERDGVSNHQRLDCLLSRLLGLR